MTGVTFQAAGKIFFFVIAPKTAVELRHPYTM
jgi:hypothetical protein